MAVTALSGRPVGGGRAIGCPSGRRGGCADCRRDLSLLLRERGADPLVPLALRSLAFATTVGTRMAHGARANGLVYGRAPDALLQRSAVGAIVEPRISRHASR